MAKVIVPTNSITDELKREVEQLTVQAKMLDVIAEDLARAGIEPVGTRKAANDARKRIRQLTGVSLFNEYIKGHNTHEN